MIYQIRIEQTYEKAKLCYISNFILSDITVEVYKVTSK